MPSFNVGIIVDMIFGFIMALLFLMTGVTLGPYAQYYFGWINATSLAGVLLAPIIILLAQFASTFYYLLVTAGAIMVFIGVVTAITKRAD